MLGISYKQNHNISQLSSKFSCAQFNPTQKYKQHWKVEGYYTPSHIFKTISNAASLYSSTCLEECTNHQFCYISYQDGPFFVCGGAIFQSFPSCCQFHLLIKISPIQQYNQHYHSHSREKPLTTNTVTSYIRHLGWIESC